MSGLKLGFYFRERQVYVGLRTMESLGMPEYVRLYVNEDEKCIFIGSCGKELDCARITQSRSKLTGNLYYTFSAPKFLEWMADIMGLPTFSESVSLSGHFVEDENLVYFDLTDYDVIPYNEQKGWRE